MLDFYTDKIVKAKKDHKCSLCGQKIQAGESYRRYSGKYEGDFFDCCYHDSCYHLLGEFCRITGENEYSEDWVADWLSERVCCNCPKCDECEENVFRCVKVIECILDEK